MMIKHGNGTMGRTGQGSRSGFFYFLANIHLIHTGVAVYYLDKLGSENRNVIAEIGFE